MFVEAQKAVYAILVGVCEEAQDLYLSTCQHRKEVQVHADVGMTCIAMHVGTSYGSPGMAMEFRYESQVFAISIRTDRAKGSTNA